jgi:vesicle coat complex subunit
LFDRYATEVDVDFVRKSVRAIGRCAIKVEPAAERCVSTLLDLIQTKVNYVVQEAIVVIKVRTIKWLSQRLIQVMNINGIFAQIAQNASGVHSQMCLT